MTLRDLIDMISKENKSISDFDLLLASRLGRDGKPLPEGKMILNYVAKFEIDEELEEVELAPKYCLSAEYQSSQEYKKAYQIYDWAQNEGKGKEDYVLFFVERRGKTRDGKIVQINMPIIASSIDRSACQIWLLSGSEEHWPQDWFAT